MQIIEAILYPMLMTIAMLTLAGIGLLLICKSLFGVNIWKTLKQKR